MQCARLCLARFFHSSSGRFRSWAASLESFAAYFRSYSSSIMTHDEGMAGILPRVAARKIHWRVAAPVVARHRVGYRANFAVDAPALAQNRDVQPSIGVSRLDRCAARANASRNGAVSGVAGGRIRALSKIQPREY